VSYDSVSGYDEIEREDSLSIFLLLVILAVGLFNQQPQQTCGCSGCKQPMVFSPAGKNFLLSTVGQIDDSALAAAVYEVNALVTSQLNQNQFDALVIYAYQLGPSDFAASAVLAEVNACNYDAAAQELAFEGQRADACLFAMTPGNPNACVFGALGNA
jgi:lysozyme